MPSCGDASLSSLLPLLLDSALSVVALQPAVLNGGAHHQQDPHHNPPKKQES